MASERQQHWQDVYETKDPTTVSWFQPSPTPSLAMVDKTGLAAGTRMVDVGGGASSLADHLLDRGFQVCVLDIAASALEVAKARLGVRAGAVDWIVADVTRWRPPRRFDLWHDRAVFHFLTEPEQRAGYVAALKAGLVRGGWLVMATFAPQGPERCSGLPVQRWSASGLAAELGDGFELVEATEEEHATPSGARQRFTWTLFRRLR